MQRNNISISLPANVLGRLSTLALQQRISRQELIENIIFTATAGAVEAKDPELDWLLPSSVYDLVIATIDSMACGDELSLKKLVGESEWKKLDDPLRRKLGKNFKLLVSSGQISGLQVGEKTPSNEQLYIKI